MALSWLLYQNKSTLLGREIPPATQATLVCSAVTLQAEPFLCESEKSQLSKNHLSLAHLASFIFRGNYSSLNIDSSPFYFPFWLANF